MDKAIITTDTHNVLSTTSGVLSHCSYIHIILANFQQLKIHKTLWIFSV